MFRNSFISAFLTLLVCTSIPGILYHINHSPHTFIRNGSTYTGQMAAEWLQWKMRHPQYRSNPIRTPEDFINRVAARSEATGEPYYVIIKNKYIKLQDYLLDTFDNKTC